MTLHLNPEERAAYKREKQRQRTERYRANQAERAWQREQRYEAIEANIAEALAENERLKAGYSRLRQQYEELRTAPAREKIVEVHIPPEPVAPADITTIGNIVRFLNDARDNQELLTRVFDEIRHFDPRQKCP